MPSWLGLPELLICAVIIGIPIGIFLLMRAYFKWAKKHSEEYKRKHQQDKPTDEHPYKICKNCYEKNPLTNQYCSKCGAKLTE